MKFENLTPHEIVVFPKESEKKIVIPPSGIIARVQSHRTLHCEIGGIPVYKNMFGEVENLPEPKENVIYLVSFLVLQALNSERDDVLSPDTSEKGAIRNKQGHIVGVKSLQKV